VKPVVQRAIFCRKSGLRRGEFGIFWLILVFGRKMRILGYDWTPGFWDWRDKSVVSKELARKWVFSKKCDFVHFFALFVKTLTGN